jgi:thiamine biosynthesis lipoprotein
MRRLAQHPISTPAPSGDLATARWEALGTSVVLRLTAPEPLPSARAIVAGQLDALDRACSRFRNDSELARVNAHAGGRPVRVAPLLIEALQVALRAAELTDGDVDPTVGAALALAGYDRDWRLLERAPNPIPAPLKLAPTPRLRAVVRSGWRTIELDRTRSTVRIPRGISLDLGATAKAWVADRAAQAVHAVCGCGVLVSLGGDIAAAGDAPGGGWRIHVTDDHRDGPEAPGQTIAITSGGLTTSSTAVRRWRKGAATMHHIIDPATGAPTQGIWRTVSVAAASCTDANIASTAALVRGAAAAPWLERQGLPARLVDRRGSVLRIGPWPADSPADNLGRAA